MLSWATGDVAQRRPTSRWAEELSTVSQARGGGYADAQHAQPRAGVSTIGLDELLVLMRRDALVDFLAQLHPFGPTDVAETPVMQPVELSHAEFLRPGSRAAW